MVQVHTGCFIVKLHEQNRNRIFSHEIMAEGKNYEKEYYRHLGIDMGMYIHMVLCFEMDHIELILFYIK